MEKDKKAEENDFVETSEDHSELSHTFVRSKLPVEGQIIRLSPGENVITRRRVSLRS